MWWFGRRSGCNRLAPVLMFALALADSPGRAADVEPAREAARVVVSGADDPRLAPFDRMMRSFVADNRVPGAALAVTRHGRLVYARGFGYASLETAEPVRPDSLFRVASVSKPVTAAAVLRLIEQGKLAMDDKALDRLGLGPDVRPTRAGGRSRSANCCNTAAGSTAACRATRCFGRSRRPESSSRSPPPARR